MSYDLLRFLVVVAIVVAAVTRALTWLFLPRQIAWPDVYDEPEGVVVPSVMRGGGVVPLRMMREPEPWPPVVTIERLTEVGR